MKLSAFGRPHRGALPALALLVTTAFAASPAMAAEQSAAIGALTLNYDDAIWSVGEDTIRCIADECLGAIVDVTMTEGLEFCIRDTGYAEAALAFPGADRHAVNARPVNGLSLVFGRSRISEDPEGWAVYACTTRDDVRYEFISRVDQTPPPYQDGAIFELLLGLVPPPPTMIEMRLGDLTANVPSDRWRLSIDEDGTATLACLPPYCDGPATAFLTVTPVDPDDPDPCFGPDFIYDDSYTVTTLIEPAEGPTFTVVTLHSMCRAWTPPALHACAVYEGQRYFLGTGALTGCNFGPAVAPDLFTELVGAFRLAE